VKLYRVRFEPDGREVRVNAGTNLLHAASMAGVGLRSVCGGEGTCGGCAVLVREGKVRAGEGNLSRRHREMGCVLACRTTVQGDLVVEVPPETRVEEQEVLLDELRRGNVLAEQEVDTFRRFPLRPQCRRFRLSLDPPTLTENASDLMRLQVELKRRGAEGVDVPIGLVRRLPSILREGEWHVTVTVWDGPRGFELVDVAPGIREEPPYGLAVDIGTTTIVCLLVDLESGDVIDRRGTYNRQGRYGDDVITRMIHAGEREEALGELQRAAVETINMLADSMYEKNGVDPSDVVAAVCAGNTTMTHLFLGIPPDHIRVEPYIPAANMFPPARAGDLGLSAHPGAPVLSFPAVSSYVGGDIVAGCLVCGLDSVEETCLFIDIGTNGEMVLGNRDWMVSCACSAGPGFEGGGITCGMTAAPGAIQRVSIDPGTYEAELVTIGGGRPVGICGTGLLDSLAELKKAGIIDRAGKFQETDSSRVRCPDGTCEYVLSWAEDAGVDRDVVVTQADVKNLLRGKGAVYAGIRSLLQSVQLSTDDIDRIFIAGGFGNYLDVRRSVQVGLLPDVKTEKYRFLGNTSVKGARLGLLSREAFAAAEELAQKMTYLELSTGRTFMDEFVSAMFLPHTDMSQFPSVG